MPRLLVPLLLLVTSLVGCSGESNIDQDAALIERAQAIHTSALTLDAHADIEIPGKPSSYTGSDGL